MKQVFIAISFIAATAALADAPVKARLAQTDFVMTSELVLQNDGFIDTGSEAYLQMGFVKGERAGVWVKVPDTVPYFKAEYFRVLISSGERVASGPRTLNNVVYFQAGVGERPAPTIPDQITNAAQVTPGPYWNDIPLLNESNGFICAKGGEYIGAAIEFTHTGVPSIFRDGDGLSNAAHNVIMAVPGGWNYSASYGLTGDWILRVVGRPATEAECAQPL